ncbi:MAG: GGDEF domain-containing protein [Gammaproteobacteria bacterium]|nr:MAG: GGDEF domain-containing protein [Gammaproteobacteria bacterium]
MSQILIRLLAPLFCLSLALLTYWRLPKLRSDQLSLLDQLPFIVCGLAAFMALLANRSRYLGAATTLLITYWLINAFLQAPLSSEPAGQVFTLTCLTLPVVLSLFIILPDTGWRHPGFLVLIAFMSIFALIIISLFQWQPLWFAKLMPHMSERGFMGLQISTAAGLLFLLALSLGIALPFLQHEQLDTSLPGCVVFSFITFGWFDLPHISAIMFSAAGLLLIINQTHSLLNMVYRDELTQIPNRRALLRDVRNVGNNYALAMVDVDHFKKINDNYGHDVGDQVLKAVAAQLRRVTGGGKAYRFGGEEFCVLFRGRHAEQVTDFLELLRRTIAEYDMTARDKENRPRIKKRGEKKRGASRRGGNIRVTVSMGVADSQDALHFEGVLKAADSAMYRAKEGGRNQIQCCY